MKKLLFLSVLFYMLTSCNQGIPSLKFEGLNGKVQSVRESQYEAVEKFGEAIPDELEQVLILDFDKDGHLLKHFLYDDDGELMYGWEQSYDGDIVTQTKNYSWREKQPTITELLSHDKHHYDYKFTSKDTTYTYVANVVEEKLYRKFTYNNSDTEVEIWFNKNGQVLEQKQTGNGELTFWVVNKYNEDRMLTESEYRGNYPSQMSLKYKEFDSKGNWTTAIMFDGDDTYVVKREIKYW